MGNYGDHIPIAKYYMILGGGIQYGNGQYSGIFRLLYDSEMLRAVYGIGSIYYDPSTQIPPIP